jgi:hypothetical protein
MSDDIVPFAIRSSRRSAVAIPGCYVDALAHGVPVWPSRSMKLIIPAVLGLVLLTGASGPGPLKDSVGELFTFRDEMSHMRSEVASLRHGRGSAAPAWVDHYASALCAADSEYLAQHSDPALGVTKEDLDTQFQRMRDSKLNCTGVRYLGSVGESQFVFVLRHGAKDVWYVMTVSEDGETIAKVE